MKITDTFQSIACDRLGSVTGGNAWDWIKARGNDYKNTVKAYVNGAANTAVGVLTANANTGTYGELRDDSKPFQDDPWSKVGSGKP